MNLVELENVSGPRVKRGCAVEENAKQPNHEARL